MILMKYRRDHHKSRSHHTPEGRLPVKGNRNSDVSKGGLVQRRPCRAIAKSVCSPSTPIRKILTSTRRGARARPGHAEHLMLSTSVVERRKFMSVPLSTTPSPPTCYSTKQSFLDFCHINQYPRRKKIFKVTCTRYIGLR